MALEAEARLLRKVSGVGRGEAAPAGPSSPLRPAPPRTGARPPSSHPQYFGASKSCMSTFMHLAAPAAAAPVAARAPLAPAVLAAPAAARPSLAPLRFFSSLTGGRTARRAATA